jgi:hypothetical protein
MAAELYEDLHVPTDPEEQRRIHLHFLRRWLELVPEVTAEVVKKAVQKGVEEDALQRLQHQFELRLSRELTPSEHAVLLQRVATLGAETRAPNCSSRSSASARSDREQRSSLQIRRRTSSSGRACTR